MSRVDIIMGVYNCSKTLNEAVDSILNQTFKDWRLIMCDDGSNDGTFETAQKIKEKYPDKILLLKNNENLGLNKTLNFCLKHTDAPYIARMDGDDISLPDRLKIECDFLDGHPQYAIVSSSMKFFDEKGVWGENSPVEKPDKKDFALHSPVHCHAPCMIRREAYMNVGGYTEDKKLLRFEDIDLWYKLYQNGYKGYNISEPLYMMRDDRNAFKRRTAESRLRSVWVHYKGFKMIDMPLKYYPLLGVEFLKQLIAIILPESAYRVLHRVNVNKKTKSRPARQ